MIRVANEGVDRPVVERLRQDDHDVVYVAELSPSITDEEILQLANARSAVLLTADKDFGELVFRRGLLDSEFTSAVTDDPRFSVDDIALVPASGTA